MEYDIFSRYYDLFTNNVDYKQKTEYLLSLFLKYDKKPSLLLDIGCGTGSFSIEFAKNNIEVIGVDPSFGMLSCAKQRALEQGLDILFLNQRGEEMDLYGTVDGAISCLDTVNHIICKRTLQNFFNRVSLFLEKNRLFIFDVNTLYKQKEVLGNNVFVLEDDKVYCVWKNYFDSKNKITDICLDFFEEENGVYHKSSEEFSERVYEKEEITAILKKAGFSCVAVLGENSFSSPGKKSQRNIYIAKKE